MALAQVGLATRKLIRQRRTDFAWAAMAMACRLAPLSAVPVLLRFSPTQNVDNFALVLTDAAILSSVVGLSQGMAIQAAASNARATRIAAISTIVTILAGVLLVVQPWRPYEDNSRWVLSVGLGVCIALSPSGQSLARRSGNLQRATKVDGLRLMAFAVGLMVLLLLRTMNATAMVVLLGIFYASPTALWVAWREAILGRSVAWKEWTSATSQMIILTIAGVLSLWAWMSIRYGLESASSPGDLSRFVAIQSVASVAVLFGDLILFRLGSSVVASARNRDAPKIKVQGIRFAWMSASFGALSCILVAMYVCWQFSSDVRASLLAGLIIVVGYSIRNAYAFVQQVLLGLGSSTIDLVGAILMSLCALTMTQPLVRAFGLSGAAATFGLVASVNLLTFYGGAHLLWRRAR
jgi:hypothetical protein